MYRLSGGDADEARFGEIGVDVAVCMVQLSGEVHGGDSDNGASGLPVCSVSTAGSGYILLISSSEEGRMAAETIM